MANFAPNGLTSLYSYSNSALAQAGIEEFPFPSTGGWNGFSGDVCASNFFVKPVAGQRLDTLTPEAPTGFVYPYPVLFDGNVGVQTSVNWIPVIGVFVGFKYTPKGQQGLIVQSTNYISGTPIEPGTNVIALVQTDTQNIYKVQASQGENTEVGVLQSSLFAISNLNSTLTYKVNITSAAVNLLNFPLGDTSPGGLQGVGGYSKVFLNIQNIFCPNNITPFCVMGMAPGSQFSPVDTPNLDPNPFVKVRLNTCYAGTTQFASAVSA